MPHLPLVLVVTAVTLAGSAWYVPALQTLRAGQDRPRPARLTAAACLVWWTAGPVAAAALLVAPASAAVAALGLGVVTASALRLRAAQVRRVERRTDERLWAQVGGTPARPDPARHRPAVVAWALAAVAVALLAAAALLATGSTLAAGALVTGLFAAAVGAGTALTIQQRTSAGTRPSGEGAAPQQTSTDPTTPRRRQPR